VIRYQITDGTAALDPERWFARLRADVDFIQIREPELAAGDLADLVRRAIKVSSCPILVNDRIDIALACGAAGAHLRSGGVSPRIVKTMGNLLVSVACHNLDEVRSAEGADYAILAPVFKPLSKSDSREPLGLANLQRLVRASSVPVIALGGITEANTTHCIEAGAAGVAGITLFAR
jgi:thiamine-phosphate pyrophosphorylase